MVDENRVEGIGKKIEGAVKENVGSLIGDKKTEAEGAAERAEGGVQNTVGSAKDGVRDAADKL